MLVRSFELMQTFKNDNFNYRSCTPSWCALSPSLLFKIFINRTESCVPVQDSVSSRNYNSSWVLRFSAATYYFYHFVETKHRSTGSAGGIWEQRTWHGHLQGKSSKLFRILNLTSRFKLVIIIQHKTFYVF